MESEPMLETFFDAFSSREPVPTSLENAMEITMSTLDTGLTLIRTAAGRVSAVNSWMGNAFKGWMPTGLYARALLIMIVPMVILQSVVAFVFMERHWNTVTRHLSAAVVQDIASLIDVYQVYPQDKDRAVLRRTKRSICSSSSSVKPK